MARYYGDIGFVFMQEGTPGVHREVSMPRKYRGELLQNSRKLATTDQVNDDIVISNRVSIVADPYARENYYAIRYAEFMGTKWKVTNISIEFPRIVLTLGGVYNGD